MKIFARISALAVVACFVAGPVFAQMPSTPAKPAAPAATSATPAAAPADKAARSAKSLDCSKQADAKKLHGKERKKFRDECKKS